MSTVSLGAESHRSGGSHLANGAPPPPPPGPTIAMAQNSAPPMEGWAQLWDKTPVVSAHTSRGIEFLERFGQFIKERALIEEEYAAKLKSLAKRSRGKKNDDEDAKMYTTASAFQAMLSEMESFASQHEVIGERLRGELLPQIMEKGRQLRAGRKKHSQDFEMMEKCLQARVDELCKQRKNYEKSHLDAQGAHVKYAKAEKNMNLTRIHLANAKQSMHDKNAVCEQNKQAYAAQVATTNQAKFDHFNVALPRLLEEMRMLDIERIQFTKQAMLDSVKVETGVLNIIQRCYADMNSAISTIDPDRDTIVVVEQTKTGYAHPHDFQFEDLGDPADILKDGSESFDGSTMKRASNGKGVGRKHSMKLFNSAAAAAKSNGTAGSHGSVSSASGGAASEYGQLPPQQRCRKIQQKLKELQDELKIKDQSQAGMQRMHGAYSQNPKLGDPTEVAKQLQQNRQEMDALQQQILRFQNLLTDAQRELNQPLGGAHHHNSQGQLHNTTTSSSSPSSSPRGSAGSASKLNNGHHPQGAPPNYGQSGRFNGSDPRASYSEASSISSVDAASMHTMNPPAASSTISPPRAGMVPQHQQQNNNTASTLSTSGFSTTVTNKSSPSPAQSQSQQQQQQQMPHIDSGSADFYEECDTPSASTRPKQSDLVLGTALAIYAYDAVPDEVDGTTISMKEGDELLLLERDVGDGWTRVRHVLSNAEGFVPTSYLDCKWYPTDGPPRV